MQKVSLTPIRAKIMTEFCEMVLTFYARLNTIHTNFWLETVYREGFSTYGLPQQTHAKRVLGPTALKMGY